MYTPITFLKDILLIYLFIYLFIYKRSEEKEREININVREKYQLVASRTCPDQGLNLQPGMRPDQEWNRQPFALQDCAQPTEP